MTVSACKIVRYVSERLFAEIIEDVLNFEQR